MLAAKEQSCLWRHEASFVFTGRTSLLVRAPFVSTAV